MTVFSDRLKVRRELKNVSKTRVAQKLNVGLSTYANWEYGYSEPDYETLKKIAKVFDTTIDYLLGDTDDPRSLKEILRQEDAGARPLEVDLAKDPVVLAYDGKPVSDEDKDIINAVLDRHNKKKI